MVNGLPAQLPADVIIYATGFDTMDQWVADLCGETVANKVGTEKLASVAYDAKSCRLLCCTDRLKVWDDIKFAFDPGLTLNPGKGVPILKRCQEYRALPTRHQHD